MASLETFTGSRLASNTSQKVIAWAVVLAICYYAQPVVITFIFSLLGAFLLEPAVGLLTYFRLPRALAALLVCLLALAVLYLVGAMFYSRGEAFLDELPRYESSIKQAVENISQRLQKMEASVMRFAPQERPPKGAVPAETKRPRARSPQPPPPIQEVRLKEESGLLAKYVLPQLKYFYQFVLFASFTPFLVYFMLSWKDHMRHGFVNLFQLENRQVVHATLNGIGVMVRAFLVGNFLLGLLLAVASALIFWYLRIPFPFIMGVVSGLLSVIPYVGLLLALIPPLFSTLGMDHSLSSYLLIISVVIGLHLLALNVLYPKLVGSRVHLNPLAVTVSVLVWSWMWGAVGLLLAVPIMAALKAVCDNVPSLRSYGELLGD